MAWAWIAFDLFQKKSCFKLSAIASMVVAVAVVVILALNCVCEKEMRATTYLNTKCRLTFSRKMTSSTVLSFWRRRGF